MAVNDKFVLDRDKRKKQLLDLNENLNILLEREAKYGGNSPLELLNQIDDHRQAIALIEQALTGGLTYEELDEALKPLLLALRNGKVINVSAETYVAGDLIQNITHILSAAEEAAQAQEIATRRLAEGARDYLHRLRNIITAEPETDSSPYKGLLAYRLSDADRFFGRDQAINELLTQLQRSPLTILHSESGAGKSSLLQAGIANRLLGQGHLSVYLRPYDQSPTLSIKRAFLPNLNDTPELAEAPLRDFLRRVTGVLGPEATLYLMLDQFEEVFTLLDDAARNEFVVELADCLEDETLTVHWVLALRTEFFGNLANFRPRIKNPFENDFRLNRLPHEQARTVITEPTHRLGIGYEPALVETLLDDLHDPDTGEVAPAQLQLVCLALYNLLRERQQKAFDLSPIITLAMYDAEGRAEGILRGHLNRVLGRTLNPQEREPARRLLVALVSSDQHRIRRTQSELAATLPPDLTAAHHLDNVLAQMVDSRLLNVHEDEQTGALSYELAHDLLLAEIELDPETQARKAAEELLKQEVEAFNRHGTLLSSDKFDIINSQRESLALDDDAAKLLRLSQDARRRTRVQRIGVIVMVMVLIVGAAVTIAIIQGRAAESAKNLAATADAERDRADSEAEAAGIAQATAEAEQKEAERQRAAAERQSRISLAQSLAALAPRIVERTNDTELAALLAVEADYLNRDIEAHLQESVDSSLRDVLSESYFSTVFRDYQFGVSATALSPDGKTLAIGGGDGNMRLWDLSDPWADPVVLSGHQSFILTVAFSPDGEILASGSNDKTIRLWNLTDLETDPVVLSGHEDQVLAVAFSPDGKSLASGSWDDTIRLWDVTNLTTEPVVLSGHEIPEYTEGQVYSVAFNPDGKTLAATNGDTIHLWDVTSPTAAPVVLNGHQSTVFAVTFSPDGKTLASGSADGTVRLWDVADFETEPIVLDDRQDWVYSLAFSLDGTALASGGSDRVVRLWNLTEPSADPVDLSGHQADVLTLVFSPDGKTLVSGSDDDTVRLWDLTEPSAEPVVLSGYQSGVTFVAFSPDGKTLASGSRDNIIRLWDVTDQIVELQEFNGLNLATKGVAFSPDGKTLASNRENITIGLWDLTDPAAEPVVLIGIKQSPSEIAFSPDGKTLASGSGDNTLLWDVTNPAAEPVNLNDGDAVAFSPDGKTLAAGSRDNIIRLWDVTDLTAEPVVLNGHESSVITMAFSPDGKTLASGSWDDTVLLWDLTDLIAEPVVLSGHVDRVTTVAFSPDGETLASGSDDKTIRLWDVTNLTAGPVVLSGHQDYIAAVAFSPDGETLASASGDATVRLWIARIDTLVDLACKKVRRNLTQSEWVRYLPNEEYRLTCPNLPPHPSLIEHGQELAKQGEIEEAITQFKKVLNLDSNLDLDPVTEAQEWTALGLVEHGRELAKQGKIEEALAQFEKALDLDPDLDIDPIIEAKTLATLGLVDSGRELAKRGISEGAMTQFTKALDLDPDLDIDPDLDLEPIAEAQQLVALGLIETGQDLAKQGDIEGAVAQFEKALDLDPDLDLNPLTEAQQIAALGLAETGRKLARHGEIERAVAQFEKALNLNPDLDLDPVSEAKRGAAWGLVLNGQELAKTGRIDEAIVDFTKAIELIPNYTSAYNSLCWWGSLLGRAADVIEACDRAVELAPNNGSYRDSRGLARALTGDLEGAKEDFLFYVEWLRETDRYNEGGNGREAWITELEAGRNPFDTTILEELRNE